MRPSSHLGREDLPVAFRPFPKEEGGSLDSPAQELRGEDPILAFALEPFLSITEEGREDLTLSRIEGRTKPERVGTHSLSIGPQGFYPDQGDTQGSSKTQGCSDPDPKACEGTRPDGNRHPAEVLGRHAQGLQGPPDEPGQGVGVGTSRRDEKLGLNLSPLHQGHAGRRGGRVYAQDRSLQHVNGLSGHDSFSPGSGSRTPQSRPGLFGSGPG